MVSLERQVVEVSGRPSTFSELTEISQQTGRRFGIGEAGEKAKAMLEEKQPCGLGNQDKPLCTIEGRATLDYDVIGELVQVPVCGEEHMQIIMMGITEDLRRQGRATYFGMNGFGRA